MTGGTQVALKINQQGVPRMFDLIQNLESNRPDVPKVEPKNKSQKSYSHEGIDETALTYLMNAKVLMKHEEFELALSLLRQASSRHPKNLEILKNLGLALEALSKWSEAKIVYTELTKQNNNFYYFYKKANSLYMLNDNEAALNAYFEALSHLVEEETELFNLYKNMGNIYVRNKDYDAAEESYNKAYTMNSESDALLINFGTLEVQREDFDKALFCFRKAIEINPRSDKAWIGLALVHNHFGDHELAWGNVIKALDIDPYNRTAVLLLGHWGNTEDKINISLKYHLSYLEQNEFDEEVSLQLIQIYSQLGQIEYAENEALKLRLWYPENPSYQKLFEEIRNKTSTEESK